LKKFFFLKFLFLKLSLFFSSQPDPTKPSEPPSRTQSQDSPINSDQKPQPEPSQPEPQKNPNLPINSYNGQTCNQNGGNVASAQNAQKPMPGQTQANPQQLYMQRVQYMNGGISGPVMQRQTSLPGPGAYSVPVNSGQNMPNGLKNAIPQSKIYGTNGNVLPQTSPPQPPKNTTPPPNQNQKISRQSLFNLQSAPPLIKSKSNIFNFDKNDIKSFSKSERVKRESGEGGSIDPSYMRALSYSTHDHHDTSYSTLLNINPTPPQNSLPDKKTPKSLSRYSSYSSDIDFNMIDNYYGEKDRNDRGNAGSSSAWLC